MRKATLILLAVAGAAVAGLDPAKPVAQYVHDVWRADNGLPQNTVTVITQSRDGYLWIGTEEGLVRFDGVAFTTLNTDNSPLKNNVILSVMEDRKGTLWVGTNGGLTRLRSNQDRTFTTRDGLAGDVVTSLCEDRQDNLWIGTDGGGLSRVRNARFQNYGIAQGLPSAAVFAIAEGRQGDLWIGTSAGLVRWNQGKFESVAGLPNHDVRALLPEPDGALWIGTNGGGAVRLHGGAMTVYSTRQGLQGNSVRRILRDSEGTLWVAALNSGLHRFSAGRFEVVVSTVPPSARDVWALFEDREGNLWSGSIAEGLHRYRNGKVGVPNAAIGASRDTTMGIFEDRDGALWLGTKTGGVTRWKDGKVTPYTSRQGLSDPLVFSIAQDRDGDIWIGTRNGLNRLHQGRIKVYTTSDGLPSNTIPALLSDRQGGLWIATRKGLCRWQNGHFLAYTTAEGLANNFVISLREAADGSIWAGTMGGGASRFHDGRFTTYGAKEGLSNGVVFDMFADSDGSMWFGTSGGGLNRWKNGHMTAITVKDGLFDNTVFRILADEQNRFWLSSNRGISRVDRQELNEFADGRIRSIRTSSYGQADGMRSQECNGGFQPAGWKTRDGSLYFPTTQGAVLIDPARSQRSAAAPLVILEKANLNGRATDVAKSADLPPGPGNLEFHFTSPNFQAPKKTVFRYRLEGFDAEWVDAGARREAYYTNIPPGRYRFRVMAANEDGLWSEASASTAFRLRPHFFQTYVFYIFCGAVLLAVVAGMFRLRLRQVNAREKELSERVKERTRELEEQIVARDLAARELKETQQRMIELSRQAGMAEVAIGVLHNVGNVLNSVNVSATLASERIGELRVDKMAAAVGLLASHDDDLADYVSRDPKGMRVIPYLSKLGTQLEQERQRSLTELEQLREHVGHIKQIVATQQNLAKVCGVLEKTALSEVAETALRIVTPSIERHGILFEREFEAMPEIEVDKHQVLQILVNLLNNAKESIKDKGDGERRIRLGIHRCGDARVRVEVRDSGVGLEQQHLTRIFAHGFTTKREGHGFGLHSGAIAAQQMQGSLWAESEGLGHGAAFILELPIQGKVRVQQTIAA